MSNILPGLNYDAVLGSQDYQTFRNLLEQAILSRFLLTTGSPPLTTPQTGIVDLVDPSQISASQTTRPYLVTVSTVNPLQISMNPGVAVTPSGAICQSSGSFSFALARVLANDVNIVFVENQIIPGGTQLLNDYEQPLFSQDVQNVSLSSALLSDWNNVTLFPPSRQANIVVLAAVSVISGAGGVLELQIDMSQNTYAFVRPWFSVRDTQHRSFLGTGTATDQNPHATSLNDLTTSSSGVGLFQGLVDAGFIASTDIQRNKMTGAVYCTESIPLSRIQTDTTGTVTADSVYNKINAKYVLLTAFPTRLGSVYQQGIPANAISAEVIEGTNILVFGPDELLTQPLVAEYTEAQALVPPVSSPTNILTFGEPAAGELIVTGGLTYSTIANPTLDLNGSGPYPLRYTVYQLGNGSLVTYPQILLPSTRLDTIGTGMVPPSYTLQQAARLRLALTRANQVSSMQVTIQIYGKDSTGAAITEQLVFSVAGGYVDEVVPSNDFNGGNQFLISVNTYAVVNDIQVISRTDDGPLTMVQVWGEVEPGNASPINSAARVAFVDWNGMGVADIQDGRMISRGFQRPQQTSLDSVGQSQFDSLRMLSTLTTTPILNQSSNLLFTELFDDLAHFDSTEGFFAATSALGQIIINQNNTLANGDTITIAPGKTLTFVAGAPNPAIGQLNIGTAASDTVTSMIAVINNGTFATGVTASSGPGTSVNLAYTSVPGTQGNAYTITDTLNNPLSITVSGYSRGYDPYGECYLDRSTIGLKSFTIPSDLNLTPYQYNYRSRYRCRAVAIPFLLGPKQFFGVELHRHDPYYGTSLRIRGALLPTPDTWTAWIPMTLVANGVGGLYEYNFSNPVHKIQVEFYGRALGMSTYLLTKNT